MPLPVPTPESFRRRRCRGARGQTTAEYALVLVAAATIATLILTWAASTNRIGGLFDLVFRSVSSMLA
jgi:hypothetical protein